MNVCYEVFQESLCSQLLAEKFWCSFSLNGLSVSLLNEV